MHTERLERLRDELERWGNIGGILLTPGPTLRYLTGATLPRGDRLCLAYIGSGGPIRAILPDFETANWNGECTLDSTVHPWNDTEGPSRAIAEAIGSFAGTRVGVEPLEFRFADYAAVREAEPSITIDSCAPIIAKLRLIKSAGEAECIRLAARVTEAAIDDVRNAVKPGVTEAEMAALLASQIYAHGGERISFGPIVLSGAKSAMPHGVPDEHPVENEALLLIDCGTSHKGYHADISRTFYIGANPSGRIREIYEAVRLGNEQGCAAVRPGATCHDVHTAAQSHFGYGDAITHRTGHGLGLDIHEPPSIMNGNTEQLQEGMVFTIEPGLYFPNLGGIRIEDDIWVTPEGCEILTTYPRELTTIHG